MEIKTDESIYHVGFESFIIEFYCGSCEEYVKPDELILGDKHIYAVHCDNAQEVACVIKEESGAEEENE